MGYCNQDSQRVVGEALKGWRDQIVLSTKNHEYEDEKVWWQHLEDSLERLQVECIDIYNHHGINWERYAEERRAEREQVDAQSAKDQGLIRHICASFHDDNEALMKIVDTGYIEVDHAAVQHARPQAGGGHRLRAREGHGRGGDGAGGRRPAGQLAAPCWRSWCPASNACPSWRCASCSPTRT